MSEINKIEVDHNSYEWSQADYQVQLAMGKATLKIVNMFKFEDCFNERNLSFVT
jgi:hypothetical protein